MLLCSLHRSPGESTISIALFTVATHHLTSNAARSLRRDARRTHGQAQSRLLADQHWTDGGYGMGKRCPLTVTWHIFNAVHSGELKTAQYKIVETFGLQIPTAVQGTRVPCKLLNPALT